MVGGGKRDESLVLNSSNVFAALGSLKKKKKVSSDKQGPSKAKGSQKGTENEVFWAPAPLTVKSWADVDDEDDDDYYATTAPPAAAWGPAGEDKALESEPAYEKSESDEVDDGDDGEEEHEIEPEEPAEVVPVVKPPQPSLPPKDSERQLSKKELKKRELEELEAMLAEIGIANKESSGKVAGDSQENKAGNVNGEAEKKDGLGESKSAKKKKRKDKTSKEMKEAQEEQADGKDAVNGTRETAGSKKGEDISAVDVKERIKKVGSGKKKKSSKEMDAAARAAANEAAARNARLAAAKKKEKNHYNQQPVR